MRRRGYVAAGILAVLAVGACSHESGGAGSAAGADSAVGGGALSAPHAGAPAGVPDAQAPVNGRAAASAGKVSTKLPLVDGVYEIKTARMIVAVKNVDTQADNAESIVLGAGGQVDSDNRTTGKHATATLQLRVPPDAMLKTMDDLRGLGDAKSQQSSTTDVTQKVVDVRSRVASATQSIIRLRKLFQQATKVTDIIALENELNTREADLESLQAQYRALSQQTSMATINLTLATATKHHAPPPAKPSHHRGGFLGGLERGWDGFTAAASWVALAVGTLLPFLVLLLAVAIGVRLLWPRLPHRHHPAPTPSPSE
jgi:hypothetical protein